MKRWNLAINAFLFASGLLTAGTAILLEWRLPHGRAGVPMGFVGWDRHQWAEVHWWVGLALVAGVVVHLALHWRWIWRIAVCQRKFGVWIGVGIVALALGFFTLMPVKPIEAGLDCRAASLSPAVDAEAEQAENADDSSIDTLVLQARQQPPNIGSFGGGRAYERRAQMRSLRSQDQDLQISPGPCPCPDRARPLHRAG